MTDRFETAVAKHEPIYDAIAAGNLDAAEDMPVAHLKMSKTWILGARSRT